MMLVKFYLTNQFVLSDENVRTLLTLHWPCSIKYQLSQVINCQSSDQTNHTLPLHFLRLFSSSMMQGAKFETVCNCSTQYDKCQLGVWHLPNNQRYWSIFFKSSSVTKILPWVNLSRYLLLAILLPDNLPCNLLGWFKLINISRTSYSFSQIKAVII